MAKTKSQMRRQRRGGAPLGALHEMLVRERLVQSRDRAHAEQQAAAATNAAAVSPP